MAARLTKPGIDNQIVNSDSTLDAGSQEAVRPEVIAVSSGGVAATLVDDAAFTPGTSIVTPVGFEYDDTTPDSVNEGDIGAGRMSANRNQYTTIRDAAGNERGANVDASGNLSVIEASLVDDAAFTVATSRVLPVGAMLDNTSPDEVNEGDVGVLRMTQRGLHVVPYSTAGDAALFPAAAALGEDTANPTLTGVAAYLMVKQGSTWDRANADAPGDAFGQLSGIITTSFPMLFDSTGGSYNRERGNIDVTSLASAARTATTNSSDVTNYNWRFLTLYLNVTVNPGGAETLTVSINGKDVVASGYGPLASYAAFGAAGGTGLTVYQFGPGLVDTLALANFEVQAGILPRIFRVTVTHSAAGSWTYSVGAALTL